MQAEGFHRHMQVRENARLAITTRRMFLLAELSSQDGDFILSLCSRRIPHTALEEVPSGPVVCCLRRLMLREDR